MISIRLMVILGWVTAKVATDGDITPSYPSDPENSVPSEPPDSDNDPRWYTHSWQADAVGLLFTGGSEFPWIVDVRLPNTDQESWAIGNLFTHLHVLTTCRALRKLVNYSPGSINIDNELSENSYRFKDAVVNFCDQYMWDNDVKAYVGSRTVLTVTIHPLCNDNSFAYDIGIVQMTESLPPKIPLLSYMPISENLATGKIVSPDFSLMEQNRWICYIASFGRNFNNLHNGITNDYKVKYRVYYFEWANCRKYINRLCPQSYAYCSDNSIKQTLDKLFCFRPRAKVGAICDHDIGAPLVCQGFVFGIVVRGVNFEFCNNLIPFPVIVRKAETLNDYGAGLITKFQVGFRSRGKSLYPDAEWIILAVLSVNLVLINSEIVQLVALGPRFSHQ